MEASAVTYFVLIFVSLVRAHSDYCTTVISGELYGMTRQLRDIPLKPPTPSWEVPIKRICMNQGLNVTVCDLNGAPPPHVYINTVGDRDYVIIIRQVPDITKPAVMQTTVFCH